MISTRSLAISIIWTVLLAPLIYAQDLSRYREFQFGMNLLSVAKQTGMNPSQTRTIHQRPALIEELLLIQERQWHPRHFHGESPLQTDPPRELLFSFYNGELFRIVANYAPHRTQGLTGEDMIEAISAQYGTARRPKAKILSFSSSRIYNDSQEVVACWEDAQYSFNLFRSSYSQPAFGVVMFSKGLDTLARAAIVEAIRLDEQEVAERVERRRKQDEENRSAQEGSASQQSDLAPLKRGSL